LGFYFIAKMVHIYVAILLLLMTLWARAYPRMWSQPVAATLASGPARETRSMVPKITYWGALGLIYAT
jgi:hypothetical protein